MKFSLSSLKDTFILNWKTRSQIVIEMTQWCRIPRLIHHLAEEALGDNTEGAPALTFGESYLPHIFGGACSPAFVTILYRSGSVPPQRAQRYSPSWVRSRLIRCGQRGDDLLRAIATCAPPWWISYTWGSTLGWGSIKAPLNYLYIVISWKIMFHDSSGQEGSNISL